MNDCIILSQIVFLAWRSEWYAVFSGVPWIGKNEFGPKFSAVHLVINDMDPLSEDDNFGINHYLKL